MALLGLLPAPGCLRSASPLPKATSAMLIGCAVWTGSQAHGLTPTDNDIAVVNMSLGGHAGRDLDCGRGRQDPAHTAICALNDLGVTTVVSAGNESSTTRNTGPANYPEVLTATAIGDSDGLPGGVGRENRCIAEQRDDTPAVFSNFATNAVDQGHIIAAPGVCVSSTYIGGLYASGSGTSFSSPIVAGTVALCIASGKCPAASPAATIATILSDAAAYNRDNPGYGFQGDPLRPRGTRATASLSTPVCTEPGSVDGGGPVCCPASGTNACVIANETAVAQQGASGRHDWLFRSSSVSRGDRYKLHWPRVPQSPG